MPCMQAMAVTLEVSVWFGLALLIALFALKFTKVRLPSYTNSLFESQSGALLNRTCFSLCVQSDAWFLQSNVIYALNLSVGCLCLLACLFCLAVYTYRLYDAKVCGKRW